MATRDGAYSLVPLLKQPRIDPTEQIEIDLYIVGSGDVRTAQLFVVHSHPDLVSDFGTIDSSLAPLTEQEYDPDEGILTGEAAEDSEYTTTNELVQNGCHFPLSPALFESPATNRDLTLPFGASYLEQKHNGDPPITYTVPTDNSVAPGEYALHMVLSYETGTGEIKQDAHKIPVHVRNTREQHNRGITIARYAAAILALLSLLVTAAAALINAGLV
ncbi:hypothetical protein [Halorubrum sp. SD626R]|jgi:hypothetical protein|uniref:hypothetical protein n=1 Tax=Halorubrum sp. SD626R TaxID=1419722 RepID=UPI000A4317D2|nr:hypothetical protein [Halorubrum sp. SD626R]TKX81343.1 hypothetical protein EXE53_06470 [Halorubrum sp. SD626R]